MNVVSIPINLLVPDPTQPRSVMADAEMHALTASVKSLGQLLPLRVTPADAGNAHTVISGHRRLTALLKLGVPTADCVIVDGPMGEVDCLAERLAENLLRENLTPIDEAEGYRRYIALRGVTAAKAAQELHVPPARISRVLPLLDLPEALRAQIHAGRVSKDTAYYLARLPAGDERQRLFDLAAEGRLSRDEAARAAKTPAKPVAAAEPVTRVALKLPEGRSLTAAAPAITLDGLIETLEDVLKAARKARAQSWDVSTLAKVLKDRAAAGGAA